MESLSPMDGQLEPSAGGALADGRILVVEDDAAIRELISLVLADEGYEVRDAAGGCSGLAALAEWRPDVIVLDLVLGDMDGAAFRAEQRRGGLGDIPVLLVTCAGDPARHAEALGARACPKPFDLDDLLGEVRGLLGPVAGRPAVPSADPLPRPL
jgi:DNA-binding response OmpR family regulator